jgi:hypothetical protein
MTDRRTKERCGQLEVRSGENLTGEEIVAQTDARTLQQIKRDTERARAGLTDTVDQLRSTVSETASDIRQRISPESIKAEVGDYFRSRGEQLLDNVTSAARRNPMQAFAVGGSIAYPLLRLARSIPVPILMVGAGLFLAGSKTGQAVTQKASDAAADFADEAGRRARDLRRGFDDTVSAARDYGADAVSGLADAVTAQAEGLKQKAASAGANFSSTADDVQREAVSAADAIRNTASDGQERTVTAAGSIADIASEATAAARDALGKGIDGVRETAETVRQRSAQFSDRAGRTFMETVEQNPLVVGGIGLLIGGFIASVLPRSDLENGLVGDASGEIKSHVREAASTGIAAAKDVAGGLYEDVARRAEEQGLTPDRLGAAATDLGQRVRRVAEAAVTTAFEPETIHSQEVDGETHHG